MAPSIDKFLSERDIILIFLSGFLFLIRGARYPILILTSNSGYSFLLQLIFGSDEPRAFLPDSAPHRRGTFYMVASPVPLFRTCGRQAH